jgi:putative ABC transport system permease protein
MHLRLMCREIRHSTSQGLVFVLCVALSLLTVVVVTSLRRDVQKNIAADARQLHGGDLIVHSHYRFSSEFAEEVASISALPNVQIARSAEFYSVVRTHDGTKSLLANIKAVSAGYPLYGSVDLQSGTDFAKVLQPGMAVVAPELLQRLGLHLGDRLRIGSGELTVGDIIERESMRPVDLFHFGPRVIINDNDLALLDLLGKGSRIQYDTMFKVPDHRQLQVLVKRLQAVADQERIDTYQTAGSRIKRFLDNLLFFLSLIALFTMLLAGIGMQSSLAALLRTREQVIAVMRGLGASWKFLVAIFFGVALVLATAGWLLGSIGGFILQSNVAALFGGVLPANIQLGITATDVVEGVGLGLILVCFFAMVPLTSIRQIKPLAVLQHQKIPRRRAREKIALLVCGFVLLGGLVIGQLGELRFGLIFVAVILVLIWCISLFTGLLLKWFAGRPLPLAPRLALRSLLRPGNATCALVATLAMAFGVLLTIFLLQHNLRDTYIHSYPPGAPNLFCLDIQKDQQLAFQNMVGDGAKLYPVVRARLKSINNRPIDRQVEREKRGDNLSREFNLSYREQLLDDEILVKGSSMFGPPDSGAVVSVLDTVADMGDIRLGDRLLFNIQGVELNATVASIRSRTQSKLYPFFYFVFPPEVLRSAPHTFFASLRVPTTSIATVETRIVNRFPNISTINVAETAAELGRLMGKLVKIVNFFASFSIIAGALILVSSILATRLERIREVAYYRMLGAGKVFLTRVVILENSILALVAGIFAVGIAQVASWAICHFILEIPHRAELASCLYFLLLIVIVVTLLGIVGSWAIIGRKPMQYLRELSQ